MSNERVWRRGEVCRAGPELAAEESCLEQARRRAARWHAWLKSPECTFQDRENFERWCSDATNAAAYVALCGNLAAVPDRAGLADRADLAGEESLFGQAARALASTGDLRLQTDAQ